MMDITTSIQVAVAWADIVICTIIKNLPYAIASLAVGLCVGRTVYRKCSGISS